MCKAAHRSSNHLPQRPPCRSTLPATAPNTDRSLRHRTRRVGCGEPPWRARQPRAQGSGAAPPRPAALCTPATVGCPWAPCTCVAARPTPAPGAHSGWWVKCCSQYGLTTSRPSSTARASPCSIPVMTHQDLRSQRLGARHGAVLLQGCQYAAVRGSVVMMPRDAVAVKCEQLQGNRGQLQPLPLLLLLSAPARRLQSSVI